MKNPQKSPHAEKYDISERRKETRLGPGYKWVVLSNTTLGAAMATIDGSILIISLPAIFNGLHVNPLVATNAGLLIWLLLGYMIVSSVVVVTIGRLSDMFGRVRMYNMGFLIFATASTLLYASSYLISGSAGALSLIILRLFQGLGGGFLIANSAAIITDAFPVNERGKAMGINQIMAIAGSVAGLIIGGVLASIDWHLIFLISVPIGIIGTMWSYLALHELAHLRKNQKLDIIGNVTFGIAITLIVIALTYSILPYDGSSTGFANPIVQWAILAGIVLMAVFVYIETRVEDPMLNLSLFRIRATSAGLVSLLLSGIARGGLQLMLIIWLQGIWLPLHGVSFENTPLQAAVAMIPLVLGFLVAGPICGYLSDRYGARIFTTGGMLLNSFGFVVLAGMPANFQYVPFAVVIFMLGVGQGMFAAPNTTAIMNSVPPEYRGVSSGMRATLMNVSNVMSIVIFFSMLTVGVSFVLPGALYAGLTAQNVSNSTALQISRLPPSTALFAALLGTNPMEALLPQSVQAAIPKRNLDAILGTNFFPKLISKPFIEGMHTVLYFAALLTFIAAIASALRGKRYIYNDTGMQQTA
ncbi:MAG: MFS transporter [Candidatus Micrarchaeaceae archaeon]